MNNLAAGVATGSVLPVFCTSNVVRLYEPGAVSIADFMSGLAAHDLISAVWEHTMERVIVADELGAIVHFNSVAERAFGYRAADVLGLTLPKLLPKAVLDDFLNSSAKSLDFERVQGVRRNGAPLPMQVRISRVMLQEREFSVIYIRDVLEVQHHRLEIERLAHTDTLTGLPNRNLLNDRLNQALAAARR